MDTASQPTKRTAKFYPSLVTALGVAVIAFCCGFVWGIPLVGDPDSLWLGLLAGGLAGLAVFAACFLAGRRGLWQGLGY